MEFFADGGFQQLFCDLNEQYVSVIWDNPLDANGYSLQYDNDVCQNNIKHEVTDYHEETYLFLEYDQQIISNVHIKEDKLMESEHYTVIREKNLQASLDYLLQSSYECLEEHDSSFNSTTLTYLGKDLSEWEDKFLDNYVEIPELIEFLPEKTPLCTETCNHFLQESAENLKLYPSPPNSPYPYLSSDCLTPNKPASCSSTENTKENDKTYPCNYEDCAKVYAKPAHLKAHLRRHMGEKPYICTWQDCSWRFSRSDELARHRRSHSGVKPYKCDFCAKCFARSDHLTKHRKVHERRLLAASKAGKMLGGIVPQSVLTVRPGRKRKNQL